MAELNVETDGCVEGSVTIPVEENAKGSKTLVETLQGKEEVEVKRSRRLSIKKARKESNAVLEEENEKPATCEKDVIQVQKHGAACNDASSELDEPKTEVPLNPQQSLLVSDKKVIDKRKDTFDKMTSEEERKASCYREISYLLLGLEETKCPICDWMLQTFDELKAHLFKHLYDPQNEIKSTSRDVLCTLCLKRIRKTSIKTHLVIVHQREVYQQSKLNTSTMRKGNVLNKQSPTKVMDFKQTIELGFQEALPYPYNCAVCGKGYFTSSPYLNHFKNIHPWLYEQEKGKLLADKQRTVGKSCKKKKCVDEGEDENELPNKMEKPDRDVVGESEAETEESLESGILENSMEVGTCDVTEREEGVSSNEHTSQSSHSVSTRASKRKKLIKPVISKQVKEDVPRSSRKAKLLQNEKAASIENGERQISEEFNNSTSSHIKTSTPLKDIRTRKSARKLHSNRESANDLDLTESAEMGSSTVNNEKSTLVAKLVKSKGKVSNKNDDKDLGGSTKGDINEEKCRNNNNVSPPSPVDEKEETGMEEKDGNFVNTEEFTAILKPVKSKDKCSENRKTDRRSSLKKGKPRDEKSVEKQKMETDISDDSDDSSSEIEEETEEEIIESSSNEDESKDTTTAKEKDTSQSLVENDATETCKDDIDKKASQSLSCTQCDALFNCESELNMHLTVHQNNPERFFNVPYPYVCLFCGNGYYRTQNLKKHLKSKHASFYTTDLEKSPSFMRRATGLEQDYQKSAKPTNSNVSLPKRDHSRFSAVLHNVTGQSSTDTSTERVEDNEEHSEDPLETPEKLVAREGRVSVQTPEKSEESENQVNSQDPPETPERRVSGRKRAINKDVLEFLQGSKTKTNKGGEKGASKKNVSQKDGKNEKVKSRKVESSDDQGNIEASEVEEARVSSGTDASDPMDHKATEIVANNNDETTAEKESEEESSDDETNKYFCKYCDWVLRSSSELSKHKRKHSRGMKKNSNQLRCLACETSLFRHDLKWHMHTIHTDESKISLKSTKKKYCMKCNFASKSKKDLEEHMGTYHPELLKIECRLCDDRFSTKSLYATHFKITHGKSIDEETLMCYLCNKKFKSLPKIHHHYSIVHMKKNENISCSLCSKFFYGQSDLDKHKEKFHKNDKFQCGLCLVEFERVKLCEDHVLIHKEKSDFKCSLCNFYFSSEDILTTHVTTHNTQILTCSVCNKDFTTLSEYQSHKALHTNEATNQDATLVKDSKEHCVNKTYNCSSCDKTFKEKSEIQAHMDKVHHGGTHAMCSENEPTDDEPAPEDDDVPTINHCKECGQTFIRPEIFAEHQKKHLPKAKKKRRK